MALNLYWYLFTSKLTISFSQWITFAHMLSIYTDGLTPQNWSRQKQHAVGRQAIRSVRSRPSRSVGTHGVPVARTDSMWRPGTKAVTAAAVGPTYCRSAHPHHLGVDAQFQRLHCHGSVEVALRLHHLPVGVQIRLNWGKYAEQHSHDEEENDEESIVSNGWTLRLLEVAQMRFGRLEAGIEVQSMTEMKHRLLEREITDLEVTKVSRNQGVMQLWKITSVSRVPNRQLRNLKVIDFYVKDFI